MPEVFDETTLSGLRTASTRAISSCFGPSRSTIASTIQSASPTQPKLSAKFPVVISCAVDALKRFAGRALTIRSKPARTIRLRTAGLSSASPRRSSSGVSSVGAMSSR